ncbi:cdc42 effector protein 3-like [Osmerus mordax]|uniref:cdc42 effector protein 3-like n=1 Tax=Osmerus mordax TaxID=8014 RepID=UPI00350EF851
MPLKTAMYFKSATLRSTRKQKRLSVNMISLPLGDFRHLSHIGLDARGEAIGDLSALQRSGSLILRSSQSHQDLFQTATPNGSPPPPPKPPRLLSPEERKAQAITKPSSLSQGRKHKKCHSLPLLDTIEVVECDDLRQEQSMPAQTEGRNAGLTMQLGVSKLDGGSTHIPCSLVEAPLVEEDPCFVLDLDLGPSILEDVLHVMDRLHQ